MHRENINYIDKHLLDSKNKGVRISTFHGLKGLEFKHVFLVDVNERTFPKLPYNFISLEREQQIQIIKAEKSLFYVSSSRAVQGLIITGLGKKTKLLKINGLDDCFHK